MPTRASFSELQFSLSRMGITGNLPFSELSELIYPKPERSIFRVWMVQGWKQLGSRDLWSDTLFSCRMVLVLPCLNSEVEPRNQFSMNRTASHCMPWHLHLQRPGNPFS